MFSHRTRGESTMSSRRSEKEQQVAAVLIIVFASLLLGMILLEFVLVGTNPVKRTLGGEFLSVSNINNVMPLFIGYLLIGAAGFLGTLGLIHVYGPEGRIETDAVRLAALGYFLTTYWLWSAMFIVQHKITLLAEKPTDPPEWVLEIYDASSAFWSLPSWGGLACALILFTGLWRLLGRGASLLPRVASWTFLALAVSRFLGLVYVGTLGRGLVDHGGFSFAMLNDAFFMGVQVIAFVLAAAALYREKGVFKRERRA